MKEQIYLNRKQGLYDPANEHDACGVGMLVNIHGGKSHDIVESALKVLENMRHRGAEGADNKTGDGAGILLQIPHEFILLQGIPVPEKGKYGTGLVFLPKDEAQRSAILSIMIEEIEKEGLTLMHLRKVPVNSDILGKDALATEPDIKQIFVTGCDNQQELELKLYVIRKRIENKVAASDLAAKNDFYVASLSTRNIVYKGNESRRFSIDTPAAQLNCQLSTVNCQLKRVALLDCGVKTNILRCLLKRDVEVIRVPWDYDFNELEFDGLFISNGPGDPDTCDAAVQNIRRAMKNEKLPIFGICMGNQLLSKAGGAKIYKLKYGHRSHNQPVRMVGTERCFITSQNHGYAVDNTTLTEDWEPLFINMNDGSNEGIRHKRNPWFSAQFHPEAASGPTDTEFLFDEFVKLL